MNFQPLFDLISITRRKIIPNGSPLHWWYEHIVKRFFKDTQKIGLPMAWKRLELWFRHGFAFKFAYDPYLEWIFINEHTEYELKSQSNRAKDFKNPPRFSILITIDHVIEKGHDRYIFQTIRSVLYQSYPFWNLVILSCEENLAILKAGLQSARHQSKISIVSINSYANTLENIQDEYSLFLAPNDLLAPNALFEFTQVTQCNSQVDFIYSDEDRIDFNLRRFNPFFKPDFSPDYLLSMNYINHAFVIKTSVGKSIHWKGVETPSSTQYRFILEATHLAHNIHHIPAILFHIRESFPQNLSTKSPSIGIIDVEENALKSHLIDNGLLAKVIPGKFPYQIHYPIDQNTLISIVIPNRDNAPVLARLINSIYSRSSYTNYELIIVENGSQNADTFELYDRLENDPKIKIIDWDLPFNYSSVNNYGISHSEGSMILLLNNDLEVISNDWLERMLEHAQRPEIGAVGAKLFYPSNLIQHSGVIVGLFGAAAHSHRLFPRDSHGYYNRLTSTQNYSAVTAACLMIRKKILEEVKGLDDQFMVEFGDVDLCLRVLQRGYRNIWTPYAQLYHHESLTRGGYDTEEKQILNKSEVSLFRKKWQKFLEQGDPAYNPNLTTKNETFSYLQ